METNIKYIETEREKVFKRVFYQNYTINLVKIEAASIGRNSRVAKKDLWRGNSAFSWACIVQKSQGSGLSFELIKSLMLF